MTPLIPGYLTTAEVRSRFGWSQQFVSTVAKREGWNVRKVGNAYLYSEIDISEYWAARERTRLARAFGWKVPGLVRHDEWDIECPTCGALAITRPGKNVEEHIKMLLSENPEWLCVNGHHGVGFREVEASQEDK